MSNSGYDINKIKHTYRLADIAAGYGFKLTERNGKWTGCCILPGHDDKTPSFAIITGKGCDHFKCMGCDRAGDVIGLVQEMEGLDFRQACQKLTGEEPAPPRPKVDPVNLDTDWKIFPPPQGLPTFQAAGPHTAGLQSPQRQEPALQARGCLHLHQQRREPAGLRAAGAVRGWEKILPQYYVDEARRP